MQLQNFFQPIVPHFASKHASSHSHVSFFFLSQNKLMLTGNLEIKYWKNYLYGLCKLFQSTELVCRYGIYVFEVTRKRRYAHWDIILRFLSQNTKREWKVYSIKASWFQNEITVTSKVPTKLFLDFCPDFFLASWGLPGSFLGFLGT